VIAYAVSVITDGFGEFCELPDADWQPYIDKFKLLGIDKCLYNIPRTEWTNDSAALLGNATRARKNPGKPADFQTRKVK